MVAPLDDAQEELAPEVALPVQFEDLWSRPQSLAPSPRLALAVLELALADCVKYRRSRSPRERQLYNQARLWLSSADRSWPLSFMNVCDALRIAPDRLRNRVLQSSAA
jgi:hypothetical protein